MSDQRDLPSASGTLDPVTPSDDVRAELEAVLAADPTLLGDIFRRTAAGETALQIQEARGAATPNFVYSYQRTIRALLDGHLPSAPTAAAKIAASFVRLLGDAGLSPDADATLRANLAVLEAATLNDVARAAEDTAAQAVTSEAEAAGISGIYVYALPHYLRHPFDVDSERTLLKVGHSDRSVIERFRAQTRTTALPEDPVLLRIYEVGAGESLRVERVFHELLEAADHARSTARTGGTEWFLTSLRFLDAVAGLLPYVRIHDVYDP